MKYRVFFKIGLTVLAIAVCLMMFVVTAAAEKNTCKADGCSQPAVKESEYCGVHKCHITGCMEKSVKGGYCKAHYEKISKNNADKKEAEKKNTKASSTCAVKNCKKSVVKGGTYCKDHTCTKKNCYKQKEKKALYCKEHLKKEMPDCDDYDCYEDFMDDWDGRMPDGSDAEDYWENW